WAAVLIGKSSSAPMPTYPCASARGPQTGEMRPRLRNVVQIAASGGINRDNRGVIRQLWCVVRHEWRARCGGDRAGSPIGRRLGRSSGCESGEGRVRGWCRLVRSARGERRPRNPGGHSGERRRGGQTSPLVGTGGHGTVCWRAGALSVAARARGAGVV